MDKIRVMIVDDNQQICELTAKFLETCENVDVVAYTDRSKDAPTLIEELHPDVLLLDLVMPQFDGFYILERLSMMEGRRPEVIVLTALSRDNSVQRAIDLGASYYMVKPFDHHMLYQRILDVAGDRCVSRPAVVNSHNPAPSLDERIANLFLIIGIPAHIKGYHFLREAVKMVLSDVNLINAITKQLYPGIAKRFNTSASKVERAIRHSIEVAWARGRIENFNQEFGLTVFTPGDKPTNGEFIALIADKLAMERSA